VPRGSRWGEALGGPLGRGGRWSWRRRPRERFEPRTPPPAPEDHAGPWAGSSSGAGSPRPSATSPYLGAGGLGRADLGLGHRGARWAPVPSVGSRPGTAGQLDATLRPEGGGLAGCPPSVPEGREPPSRHRGARWGEALGGGARPGRVLVLAAMPTGELRAGDAILAPEDHAGPWAGASSGAGDPRPSATSRGPRCRPSGSG
jgi:hypothetical protein